MIWYLVMAGMFLAYQLDVIFYSVVAYAAALFEWWDPEPGNPSYHRKHPSALVYPPTSASGGQLSHSLKIARTKSGKEITDDLLPPTLEGLRPGGWTISTAAEGGDGDAPRPPQRASAPDLPRISASGVNIFESSSSHIPTTSLDSNLQSSPVLRPSGGSLRLRSNTNSETGQRSSSNGDGFYPPSSPIAHSTRGRQQALQMLAVNNAASRSQQQQQLGGADVVVPLPMTQALHRPCLLPETLVKQYITYPLVLVQLPMYNEEAHCELVIERACRMEWPRDRVIIQVCDDSTREDLKRRIDAKAEELRFRGHDVQVCRREKNAGYKAGNMINGMAALSDTPWEFVAVFDADFEMAPDFLYQTVYHLIRDPRLAFVQTRWTFTNGYDNLLCWVQQVCMNYHFAVEQRARSFLRTFFGFNGTGGIWRRAAMEEVGSWSMDSTVEDMDLSLRAYLQGWKFKYLHWVKCPNELPPTLSAYRSQQYRWNSGPMVVMKTMVASIWSTKFVTLGDRISATYFFFRFVYGAFLTLVSLLCVPIILWLDPWKWEWPQLLFLVSGNTAAVTFIFFAGLLFWPYFLAQTGLGYFRVYAMAQGLRGSKKAKGWTVTKKFGGKPGKAGKGPGSRSSGRQAHKPYLLELVVAAFYLAMAFWSCWERLFLLTSFSVIMVVTFTSVSFGDYWI